MNEEGDGSHVQVLHSRGVRDRYLLRVRLFNHIHRAKLLSVVMHGKLALLATESLLLIAYKAFIVAEPPHLPWILGNMLIAELFFDISWASGMLVPSDLESMIR